MPVYLAIESRRLVPSAGIILVATAGAVAGTVAGRRILERIPRPMFRKLVAVLVLALGVYMCSRAWTAS